MDGVRIFSQPATPGLASDGGPACSPDGSPAAMAVPFCRRRNARRSAPPSMPPSMSISVANASIAGSVAIASPEPPAASGAFAAAAAASGPEPPPPRALAVTAAAPSGFPPAPSSSGKKYYVFCQTHGHGPLIAAGQHVALRLLGGSWIGRGKAPKGFKDLEEAIAHLASEWRATECRIVWA